MNEVLPAPKQAIDILPEGYQHDVSLAVQLTRAEVDQQIATARAFPRKLSLVVSNILTLATMDEQTADDCIYALPRGGKSIEGPSIRLAEIIFSQWGNCRSAARVVHVDRTEKFVEAEGIFHDLETNAATTMRVRRRIEDKNGKIYDNDLVLVTGNAACSIAKRNAIIGGVPRAVWRKAYEACEQVLRGDIKTLAARRDAVFKHFAGFGIAPEQIFAVLGIAGVDDLNLDHMVLLTGMRSAIKNGEATIEELFPRNVAAKPGASLAERLDKVAGVKSSEQVDAKTGEVTDKPKAESEKAPAETKKPETTTADESAAAPKPRGRPRKAQEGQEAASGANVAGESEKAAQRDASPAPAANRGEDNPPFDTDGGEGAGEEGEEDENPVFTAGREAALKGSQALKKWKNRLSVKELASVVDQIKALEKFAADMDAANKGE